jgi:hypothetical protein
VLYGPQVEQQAHLTVLHDLWHACCRHDRAVEVVQLFDAVDANVAYA